VKDGSTVRIITRIGGKMGCCGSSTCHSSAEQVNVGQQVNVAAAKQESDEADESPVVILDVVGLD
jgi:hypothetical protein